MVENLRVTEYNKTVKCFIQEKRSVWQSLYHLL